MNETYTCPDPLAEVRLAMGMIKSSVKPVSGPGVMSTVTCSRTVSGMVFETLYWKTTCSLKMCLTRVTTYSVSDSVSSIGFEVDLRTGPYDWNSGMADSWVEYADWTSALEVATGEGSGFFDEDACIDSSGDGREEAASAAACCRDTLGTDLMSNADECRESSLTYETSSLSRAARENVASDKVSVCHTL